MSIYHPPYLKFIKNERKTLEWLMNSPRIGNTFPNIAQSASNSYYNLPSKDKDLLQADILFKSKFELFIARENRNVLIILDVQVRRSFSISNYVISIAENSKPPYNLIRKFHFDYCRSYDYKEPKPAYHLQYGGIETPLLNEMGISTDALTPWLSNPRICSYPMNLALLLDAIFCEFISDDTNAVVGTSEWRDFVKENEVALLRPYLLNMSNFINGGHTSNFLIRDCLYGKQ